MRSATVVGAGVFGAWTAHALRARGWRVTLVEQYGPGNSRASSGGETRIIRSGYGSLATYSRWARDSMPEWLRLEADGQEQLFVRTGVLFIGAGENMWLADTAATLESQRIPIECLDPSERRRRFPQLCFGDADGLLEPEAGVLFARRAVRSLARRLTRDGVTIERRQVDPTSEIRENTSDALIFACGAWLAKLFPELPADPILATRQEVFFFGPPAGDDSFDPTHLPAWVAFDEGIYGMPDLEHRGAKIAIDSHGPEVDPDTMDRVVDGASLARVRNVLRARIPALADAPLLESRVCQYENTSDGHFLLDRLPGHDRVWIAGGGSGHGFKHGPAVGRYMADLIEGGTGASMFELAGRPPRKRAVF